MGPMIQRKCRCGDVFTCREQSDAVLCQKCIDHSYEPLLLALLRRSNNLDHTIRSVAYRSGLHKRTVDDFFARRKRPTLDTLTKIAHALGCRVTIETDDGQTIYSSKEE